MIVHLSQDLMLISKIDGVARQLGCACLSTGDVEAISTAKENCRLVVIDLSLGGLDIEQTVNQIRNTIDARMPIVAFGPHVHKARLDLANSAGCDVVVSRGQWDRDALAICRELLGNSAVN